MAEHTMVGSPLLSKDDTNPAVIVTTPTMNSSPTVSYQHHQSNSQQSPPVRSAPLIVDNVKSSNTLWYVFTIYLTKNNHCIVIYVYP